MIRYLDITDPTNTHIEWWDKVEAFKKPRKLIFKPGLNILWGKNGSGKSTLIKALARLTHCEQSGNPVTTRTSIHRLFERWRLVHLRSDGPDPATTFKDSVKLSHDGQGVRYFDPGHAVGLEGGHFDDDFFQAGFMNCKFKGSSGETTVFRSDTLINAIIEDFVPEIEDREKVFEERPEKNGFLTRTDSWLERSKIAAHFLKGSGKKGQPTILLDEPSRSLDLLSQVRLWELLRAYASTTQFIVASHSLFALGIPDANYIELTEGYLDDGLRCRDWLPEWEKVECKRVDPKIVAKVKKAKKDALKKEKNRRRRSSLGSTRKK